MRSRNIKPGFFKDYELADCGMAAQLLYIGLWCLADKEGMLLDRPRFISAEVFPYSDVDVNRELTVIERLGVIKRYEIGGKKLIEVVNFKKHQNPHHTEKKSELPKLTIEEYISYCNKKGKQLTVDSPLLNGGNPADSLIPDSLIPDSLIPETSPSGDVRKKSKKSVATSLPEDFSASPAVVSWYEGKNYTEDIALHLESFVTKCKAKAYSYADWDAAFRNAIADDWAKLRGNGGNRSNGDREPNSYEHSSGRPWKEIP